MEPIYTFADIAMVFGIITSCMVLVAAASSVETAVTLAPLPIICFASLLALPDADTTLVVGRPLAELVGVARREPRLGTAVAFAARDGLVTVAEYRALRSLRNRLAERDAATELSGSRAGALRPDTRA